MFCPKCGVLLETYITYCAGQPIVVYFCSHCHYSSTEVEIVYSNKTIDVLPSPPYSYEYFARTEQW